MSGDEKPCIYIMISYRLTKRWDRGGGVGGGAAAPLSLSHSGKIRYLNQIYGGLSC